MRKFFLFVCVFVGIVLPIGIFSSYLDYRSAEDFAADGIVTYIEWRSRNHKIPLIEIKQANGILKRFHHSRIILSEHNLNVGDSFTKKSGSSMCTIRGELVKCIR